MSNPYISIVIPVYNVEQFLEKCIRSCENQDIDKPNYELILINDGSKDGSWDIAQRLSCEFPNIKLIVQENKGLSGARNTGIRNSSGEYIFFLDSDDWISPNSLGKIYRKLETEGPDCLAICAADIYGDEIRRRFSYNTYTTTTGVQFLKNGAPDCAPFSVWKKEFLINNKFFFFEGIYHEDSELTPRAYYVAKKISYLNDIIYNVYQNPNSITRSVNYKRAFDYIGVVSNHLSEFAQKVEVEHRIIFDDRISIYINNALHVCKDAPADIQNKLNKTLMESQHLFVHLKKASKKKYHLEYILFSLFSGHTLQIYKLLKLL